MSAPAPLNMPRITPVTDLVRRRFVGALRRAADRDEAVEDYKRRFVAEASDAMDAVAKLMNTADQAKQASGPVIDALYETGLRAFDVKRKELIASIQNLEAMRAAVEELSPDRPSELLKAMDAHTIFLRAYLAAIRHCVAASVGASIAWQDREIAADPSTAANARYIEFLAADAGDALSAMVAGMRRTNNLVGRRLALFDERKVRVDAWLEEMAARS